MANLSIHKIFMDNVQTIKNIQISNGEFHPDNEVYGKNIGTIFFTYFFGYLRHRHNVDTIKMTSFPGTHEINKK